MKLVTREIVREIDRKTIEEYGIPGLILMENAGRAVAKVVMDERPNAKKIAIFAGGGNNGGDGFVVAPSDFEFLSLSICCCNACSS